MLTYAQNPRVYLDPTVISYAVADPSADPKLAAWQAESRRFLNDYQHQFDFVVSDSVLIEIRRGDTLQAMKREAAIAHLHSLPLSSQARALARQLVAARAIPENSGADAEHTAIATVHGVDYLASWNHKHLVNENQLRQIHRVCEAAGFRPVIICTPTTLMEEFVVKEIRQKYPVPDFDPETYTDPVLEECYRIKREISEEFKTIDELYEHLAEQAEKERKKGRKYLPLPPHLTEYRPKKKDESD